jgi:hypothetical protein
VKLTTQEVVEAKSLRVGGGLAEAALEALPGPVVTPGEAIGAAGGGEEIDADAGIAWWNPGQNRVGVREERFDLEGVGNVTGISIVVPSDVDEPGPERTPGLGGVIGTKEVHACSTTLGCSPESEWLLAFSQSLADLAPRHEW